MSEPERGRAAGDAQRVWIVNHYADAPDRSSGTRHYDLARQLIAHGHEVTIFASGFSHPTGREERLSHGRLYRTQRFDGVRFVWLRTLPYRGNTLRRQLNMLTFVASFLVVQARFRRPQTVIGSTVHPFAALAAWLVARTGRARFVFEIRDLWPQTLVDLGAIRVGSPGERMLRAIEAFLVRDAVTVVTLLPGMRDYLAQRALPFDHVVYLPNGVSLAAYDVGAAEPKAPPSVRAVGDQVRRLRDEGRFVLGYVGSFGLVNRTDLVVEAAAIAEERAPRRIGLVLVGDGPRRPEVAELARGRAEVAICESIPKRNVPSVLGQLDATVVHATATPVYRYGISFNKVFEYMAAGRPVVFACASAYDPVAAAGAGLTVAPDEAGLMADAFLALAATSPADRARMGAGGRAYVAREHNMARLGETLDCVVRGVATPIDGADAGAGGVATRAGG